MLDCISCNLYAVLIFTDLTQDLLDKWFQRVGYPLGRSLKLDHHSFFRLFNFKMGYG